MLNHAWYRKPHTKVAFFERIKIIFGEYPCTNNVYVTYETMSDCNKNVIVYKRVAILYNYIQKYEYFKVTGTHFIYRDFIDNWYLNLFYWMS